MSGTIELLLWNLEDVRAVIDLVFDYAADADNPTKAFHLMPYVKLCVLRNAITLMNRGNKVFKLNRHADHGTYGRNQMQMEIFRLWEERQ